MVGGEITAVGQQPVHNNWHLRVCVRNSGTKNQQSDILESYDVTALFTNVPLDETIQIIADKAFINNTWTSAKWTLLIF